MSHSRKSSILWVIFSKEEFNSLSHTKKSSILWVIIRRRFNSSSQYFLKVFNSWSHIRKKGLILWVVFPKKVQFFESQKRFKILKDIFEKKNNSLSPIQKKYFLKRRFSSSRFLFWVIFSEITLNSLSHIFWRKKSNSLSHISEKKSSILRVIFPKKNNFVRFFFGCEFFGSYFKKFSSLSHTQKRVQFLESYFLKRFNPLSHIWNKFNSQSLFLSKKKFNLSRIPEKVQFCESYSRKKGSILCVIFKEKRVQFFESHRQEKGSILWVTSKEKDQFFESYSKIVHNSLGHTKKEVQFFESC